MGKAIFLEACVGWPRQNIHLLEEIIEKSKDITFETFKRNTDWKSFKSMLYVNKKLDWHVRFKSSKVGKNKFYFFIHSAIEYVFSTSDFDHILN